MNFRREGNWLQNCRFAILKNMMPLLTIVIFHILINSAFCYYWEMLLMRQLMSSASSDLFYTQVWSIQYVQPMYFPHNDEKMTCRHLSPFAWFMNAWKLAQYSVTVWTVWVCDNADADNEIIKPKQVPDCVLHV